MLVAGCALAVTVAVGLVVWAVAPRRRPLTVELDDLLAVGPAGCPPAAGFSDSLSAAVWSTVSGGGSGEGERFAGLGRDLAVMGQSPALFVRQMALTASLFGGLAAAVLAFAAVEGLHPPAGLAAGAVVLAGVAGAAMPRAVLAGQAGERRAEMREVVAVVCDLAAVLVAAGEDVDGALVVAAGAGEGWAFDALRAGLPAGGFSGAWSSLQALGERLGVGELVMLAQSMGLAVERGAKIREALNTQAKALREEAASEVAARAGSMTERMSFPMVLLLAGFLMVIGYPAVARL